MLNRKPFQMIMAGGGGGGGMGGGGWGGSIEEERTKRTEQQRRSGTRTTDTQERQTSTQQERQQQQQVTSLLDPQTEKDLQDVVQQLLGGQLTKESASQKLAEALGVRAEGADEAREGRTEALVGQARLQGERRLQELQQRFAQQVGGSLANTGVISAVGEAGVSLESEIAALEATLKEQDRQAATQELLQAFQAAQGSETAQADIAAQFTEILKGSRQITDATSQTDIVNELERLLASTEQYSDFTDILGRTRRTKARVHYND